MDSADLRELARAVIAVLPAGESGGWCQRAAIRLLSLLARGVAGVDGVTVAARLRMPSVIVWQSPARCIVSMASGPLTIKAALARALLRDGRSAAVLVTLCAYMDGAGADVACTVPCDPDALLRLGIITHDEYRAMRETLKQSAPPRAPREV
jgi:predicted benzoate:H+ symporter BenE